MIFDTNRSTVRTYQIKLNGQVDDEFTAAFCPPGTVIEHDGETTLLNNIQTDQSGIVGLIRHLHNLGCTLISIQYEPGEPPVR